jgi:predicted RND superfamily exporter protein
VLERLATFVTTRRRTVIFAGLVASLTLAPWAIKVPLDNSVPVWTVDDPKKLEPYLKFRDAFGSDEQILAVVRGRERKERGDRTLLAFVRDLAAALDDRARFPQVEDVVSILTLARSEVEVLLDEDSGGWGELPRLRSALTGSPLNREFRLLDLEHDLACVGITVRPGDAADRRELLRALDGFRTRAQGEGRELLLAGEPIINVELDEGARDVETRFLPLLIGVCIATMLVLTRSVRTTTLVLVPVGLAVLAMTGLVGVTGASFNLLLVIAKPLVFVLALATGLHFAQSYTEGLREGMDRIRAARRAFDEKAVPCLFTTAAAVYGFGSLVTAGVRPIRALGGFSAAGMLWTCALMIGPLLAALASFGPDRPPHQGPDRFGALAQGVVRVVTRKRSRAIASVLVCIALCALGGFAYTRLEVDTNSLHYFKKDRPVRAEYGAIEDEGLGLFAFEVVARMNDGTAAFGSTAVLEGLREFEKAARARPPVTQAISFADVLADSSFRSTGSEDLPDASIIRDALSHEAVVAASKKLLGEGRGLFAHAARVTVFAKTDDTGLLAGLMAELARDFDRTAGVHGLKADFTGTSPLMLATQLSLLGTLGTSLGGAAVTIGLTVLVFVRSLRRAVLAVLPNALPILLNFAVMRAASMPLDVGTVMVSSIVLGIAVDNTIHYFFHYRRALARGESLLDSLATAARIAGRSLVLATAITVTGFLTLLLSSFAPTWRFGLLAATGLGVAVVGTIVVLPALLLLFDRAPEKPTGV